MTFELNGSKPIYKQLMDEILAKIRSGELIPGAKLPTERELAQQLYVSRGTIKKAYKELADNNIIEIIQGSGTYVYAEKKLYDGGMRKQATNMINSLLDRLEFWDFPMEEIETLFHMCVTHRTHTSRPVRCAMIDCNSESLGIFKRQLSYLPDITLSAILVDSVIMDDTPEALLADYDFVFTGNLKDYRNPEYIDELKKIMEAQPVAGSIKLLGFVERTEQLCIMKNAAFIVQPSLCEGWGTVLEDAKVLDKAVLLSDIPVHREQKNEKCVLFDPHDPKALAQLLVETAEKADMPEHTAYFAGDMEKGIANMYREAEAYARGLENIFV